MQEELVDIIYLKQKTVLENSLTYLDITGMKELSVEIKKSSLLERDIKKVNEKINEYEYVENLKTHFQKRFDTLIKNKKSLILAYNNIVIKYQNTKDSLFRFELSDIDFMPGQNNLYVLVFKTSLRNLE